MRYGHVEKTSKYGLTGNRYETVIDIFECEDRWEVAAFCETYDFEPSDILALMNYLSISYKVTYEQYDDGDVEYCKIESDGLIFIFNDGQIQTVYKKYNVYDELMEKFNLKPLR